MNPAILIPVLCIVILMLCNVPVWIAMFAGVLPYFISLNHFGFAAGTAIQRLVATMETTSYLAIPYFVTAGAIMNYSGISKRLLDFADALIGHLTGGLGHVNVLLSVFMGGISGSAAADAAMECKMLVPEMERKGYSKEFSAAVTLASSLITPIIPPGMGLIVYAMLAEVSVGRMFAAGYLPGFLTAILMMILVYVISKKHGYKGSREKMAPLKEILKLALDGFWALIIPGLISTYYVIILRTALTGVPKEMIESAELDGANEMVTLVRILLPLIMPTIAAISLFIVVGYWNSWTSALLYIQDNKKMPLQMVLRQIVVNNDVSAAAGTGASNRSGEDQATRMLLKYATIMVSVIPIICVYPFLQKYFTKGVMVGALKG